MPPVSKCRGHNIWTGGSPKGWLWLTPLRNYMYVMTIVPCGFFIFYCNVSRVTVGPSAILRVICYTKHQQIDIAVYKSNPEKYEPQYCLSHEDQKLVVACYNCCKLYCTACEPERSSCSSGEKMFEEGLCFQFLLHYYSIINAECISPLIKTNHHFQMDCKVLPNAN